MTVPEIQNEPCNCPKGQCAEGLERDDHCINRLTGDVRVLFCEICMSHTWHQDSQCVRCGTNTKPANIYDQDGDTPSELQEEAELLHDWNTPHD